MNEKAGGEGIKRKTSIFLNPSCDISIILAYIICGACYVNLFVQTRKSKAGFILQIQTCSSWVSEAFFFIISVYILICYIFFKLYVLLYLLFITIFLFQF